MQETVYCINDRIAMGRPSLDPEAHLHEMLDGHAVQYVEALVAFGCGPVFVEG